MKTDYLKRAEEYGKKIGFPKILQITTDGVLYSKEESRAVRWEEILK